MNRFLAVVFDMDGLMFNTEEVYWDVASELLARRGLVFTPELNAAIMGRPPQPCFETIIRWHNLNERWEDLAAESETLFLEMVETRLAPMPGLFPLLEALEAAGIPKAVCTSSRRRVLQKLLGTFSLEPRFAFTLTAEDVSQGKPHPEVYLRAAERFGIPPEKMMVLEDSPTGCSAARAAGAFVVAVPNVNCKDTEFSCAHLVVPSLENPEIYELLGLPYPQSLTVEKRGSESHLATAESSPAQTHQPETTP
jgi:HAD superfamily hydrolase (TIGR01509 family)